MLGQKGLGTKLLYMTCTQFMDYKYPTPSAGVHVSWVP